MNTTKFEGLYMKTIGGTNALLMAPLLLTLLALAACGSGGGSNTPGNTQPIANAGPDQNVTTGTLVTLDGSASDDADGDLLTYTWSFLSVPGGSVYADEPLSDPSAVKPSFIPDVDGEYVVSLVVNDGTTDSAPDSVTITAATGNSAPVANAGPDQNVLTGRLVTLDGSASYDADGDPLAYAWSFSSAPEGSDYAAGMPLSDAWTVNPSFTPDVDGEYVVSLVVNDSSVDSAPDTVTVTAATNSVPVANAGPDQTVIVGTLVTLDGSGSTDADGDALNYLWSWGSMPSGSTATLSHPTTVNPTFTPDLEGDYVIRLQVSDGINSSYTDTVTVTAARLLTLADTGQTLCYGSGGLQRDCAGTGQDGEYAINPPSFTDNGDGTVTDDVSGLMWQRCSIGLTSSDCSGGIWEEYNWYEATGTYDATYNPSSIDICGSLDLAGHTDWRLPTKKELVRIIDYGTFSPAIDGTAFPRTDARSYWSSTTYAGGASFAFVMSFVYGDVNIGTKNNNYLPIRCVRGQSSAQSFTDNLDGTVTDNMTGLMWQQADDDAKRTWQSALDYCNGLSLGGHDDWRLPNVKELESIIDDAAGYPAIDTSVFPGTNMSRYWSSTSHESEAFMAWDVGFDGGTVTRSDKITGAYYVRCVR